MNLIVLYASVIHYCNASLINWTCFFLPIKNDLFFIKSVADYETKTLSVYFSKNKLNCVNFQTFISANILKTNQIP